LTQMISKEIMPLVSVVVPTYNVERYIDECFQSIFGQTYKNIEVIVVHTVSPDETYRILHKYLHRVKLVKTESRLPISRIRNLGVRQAEGDYIAFCDADDCWHPEKIRCQIETHLSNYGVGLTYTDLIRISETGQEIGRLSGHEWNFKKFLRRRFIAFSSVMVKTKLIKEAGLFDEKILAEDFDLLIRLSRVTNFKRVAGFYTYYRITPGSLSRCLSRPQHHLVVASVFAKHHMTKLRIKCYLRYILVYFLLTAINHLRRFVPHDIEARFKKIKIFKPKH